MSTSAATEVTTAISALSVPTFQGASHASVLLALSAMALLAAAHPATSPPLQEMPQFVSTSMSAVTAPTIVTSTPCAQTLQGASIAHAQQILPMWAQDHPARHVLARRIMSLMAMAQLLCVRDLQAPVMIAHAIQILLRIRMTCDLFHADPMELVG